MLSPASHRVCCLAVMAPALTKAVRQADCLPVVLSKTYCVRGTTNYTNIQDSVLSNDADVNNSMPHDRTWCQPPLRCELLLKSSNLVSQVSPVVLLSPSDRTNAELKASNWNGTNFATAISARIRLKTTMNRNSNLSVKNMGLAKANTSLSFQSPKKIHRVMPVSHTSALTSKTQRILQLPEKPLDVSSSMVSGNYVSSTPSLATTIIENSAKPLSKLDGIGMVLSPPVAAMASTVANEIPSSISHTGVKDNAEISVSVSTIVALPTMLTTSDSTIPNFENVTVNDSDSVISSENSESTLSANSSPSSNTSMDIPITSVVDEVSLSPVKATSEPSSSSPPILHVFSQPSTSSDILDSQLSAPKKVLMRYSKESRAFISTLTNKLHNKLELLPSSEKKQAEVAHHSLLPHERIDALKAKHMQADQKCTELRSQTLDLQLKHINHYIKQQLRGFVKHYQSKLGVPCQRQATRLNLNRRGKDPIDIKAELLQSENVRSLSTAALVSLVRKMESSPEKYITQQTYSLSSNSVQCPSSDNVAVQVEPREWEDVKKVSNSLASDVRRVLSTVDPDVTDVSSDEGSCDESDVTAEELLQQASQIHKKALRKYLGERAAIASRWTWLVAQVHDLEYHLRRLGEVSKQLRIAKGAVCFEEQDELSESSLLPTQSDSVSIQTSKEAALKSIIKPMNGYLDHSTPSSKVEDDCESILVKSQALTIEPSFQIVKSPTQTVESPSPITELSTPTVEPSSPTLDAQLDSGTDEINETNYSCRTRALKTSAFRKRKLLTTEGLHLTSAKASRLSTVGCSCNCQSEMLPCVLCGGRYNNVQSVDPDTMPLLERVALLVPSYHPVLSFMKDVPLQLHFENALKKKEAYYQSLNVHSQVVRKPRFGAKPKRFSDIRNHNRKLKYPGSLLSAKYRRKHVRNSSGHYRKKGLIFGKWRKFQNKRSIRRMRRYSVASSVSSMDSPIPSPSSLMDDSYGYDQFRKRKDDFPFDIDDVIMPCNSKARRYEKLQYKDIEIPSWRYMDLDETEPANEDGEEIEDVSEAAFSKRYIKLEIEERKTIRAAALDFTRLTSGRRGRRPYRFDSRADSSGANTPDPVLLYQQDIMFQDPSCSTTSGGGPVSPALSPPATPSSAHIVSDDSSQPATLSAFGRDKVQKRPSDADSSPFFGSAAMRLDRKVTMIKRDRSTEDSVYEHVDVSPYEPRVFPLSDIDFEDMLKESTHFNDDEQDSNQNALSSPASPATSSESTSTVDEDDDDDITDPEWTVVKRDTGPDQALVLKFAKR